VAGRRRDPFLTPEEVLKKHSAGPKSGVFTDGSCEGNPGPGGWGFVWVEDDQIVKQGQGKDPGTTNNRMELKALIEAYKGLPTDSAVTVYSDSQLCVNTVNQWAASWEKRGWQRKGGPIKNLELVQELYALAGDHPSVKLTWIRAHDGSRWNEYADALASAHMRK
jgi:ribonuclease HI